jgi:PAS domain S-box-containing protein
MGALTRFILESKEYKEWVDDESTSSKSRPSSPVSRKFFSIDTDSIGSYSSSPTASPEKGKPIGSLHRKLCASYVGRPVSGKSKVDHVSRIGQSTSGRRNSRYTSLLATTPDSTMSTVMTQPTLTPRTQQRLRQAEVSLGDSVGLEVGLGVKAVTSFELGLLDGLLVSNRWLTSLIQISEHLPFSLNIASSCPKAGNPHVQFPILYANQAFLNTSGYERSDVLGQNCLLLYQYQRRGNDSKIPRRMHDTLLRVQPVKEEVICHDKSGKACKSLVAMKPIMDQRGIFRYVLSFHFNLRPEANREAYNHHASLLLMDQCLRLFPDTILSSPNEEIETA